jgi:hypothetical protein
MFNPTDRRQFLKLAVLFEGSLAVLALVIGWFVDVDPLRWFSWNWFAVAWGLLATFPLFALFVISYRFAVGPLWRIKRFLVEGLGPSLAVCRWYELLLIAVLAGACEEILFRGLFQQWFLPSGRWTALIGSNLLFGLAHCVTPLYAIFAGTIGCYLGIMLDMTDPPNLLAPIVTHTFYDFLAFLVVARTFRNEQATALATNVMETETPAPP